MEGNLPLGAQQGLLGWTGWEAAVVRAGWRVAEGRTDPTAITDVEYERMLGLF